MKRLFPVCIIVISVIVILAFSSCSGKKAEEIYETAQFEELQRNYPHARQLYQEIIEKYPESDFSKRASERLKALGDQP